MQKSLSCAHLFVTPLSVACQAPLSMGFSRQEYRSGLPFPTAGDLPDPGTEPTSLLRPLHWLLLLSRFSRVRLLATLWTIVLQAPLSMEFSRQEYWSGLPCPPPGDLPNPGIKPTSSGSPALQVNSIAEAQGKP